MEQALQPALAAVLGIFISSFTVGMSGALMPGPLMTLTITESSRRGFWAGPLLIAGHAVLEGALLVLLLAGLGPILRRDMVVGAVGLVGAGILLWMAAGNLLALPRLKLQLTASGGGGRSPVLAGALVSLSNPYWVLWWATVGITYLNLSQRYGTVGLVCFYAGHILSDLLWYSLLSLGIARGRRFLSDSAYRLIVGACSLFLVGLAAWFAIRGAGRLFG